MIRFVSLPIILGLSSVIFLVSATVDVHAADWPQFHGPAGDNISTEAGLLKQWPDGGPELMWTAKGVGDGFASVSVAGGLIYTAGSIGGETVVMALDLDGNIVWQTACGAAWTKNHPGARGTPAVDGDRLYYESPFGDVVCLDAKTGQKHWGLNILDQFEAENITWALAESVLVDGNNLICCPFGEKGSVVALNMDNHHGGVILWEGYLYGADSKRSWVCFDWDTGETKYSEPGVGKGSLTCADGMLYTFSESSRTVGLVKPTPEGHEMVSQFQIPEGGQGRSWAHPVVCSGRLYLRHGDFLFAYDVRE